MEKEKLIKQLNAIKAKEHKEMIAEWLPKIRDKYLGKCFKSRNSYGSSSKGWWSYTMVTSIEENDIYDTGGNGVTSYFRGWNFQVTSANEVVIKPVDYWYVHLLDKQISEDEFNRAYNDMIDKLTAIPTLNH